MVFSLASAAVVCATLDSTSDWDSWSVTTAPRYLKLPTSSNFSLLILMSMLITFALLVISLVFSALISTPKAAEVLSRRSPGSLVPPLFLPGHQCNQQKGKLVIVLPPMLTVPWWSSSASVIILSRKILKRVGESETPLSDSDCGSELVSYATFKVDCSSGLFVEVFNDFDQVGINFIKPHSRPKGFTPYPVKRLFKINKGVIEVLLMLEVLLAQYPKIKDLLCRTATCSETCLFFCDDWFCLTLQPI